MAESLDNPCNVASITGDLKLFLEMLEGLHQMLDPGLLQRLVVLLGAHLSLDHGGRAGDRAPLIGLHQPEESRHGITHGFANGLCTRIAGEAQAFAAGTTPAPMLAHAPFGNIQPYPPTKLAERKISVALCGCDKGTVTWRVSTR